MTDSALNGEKLRYHGILARHQPASHASIDVTFPYSALHALHPNKVRVEPRQCRVAIAGAIPPDGRIQLPFDLHWFQTRTELEWKVGQELREARREHTTRHLQNPPNDDKAQREYFLLKQDQEIDHLESFFGQDFNFCGKFLVQDYHPRNDGASVTCNLRGRKCPMVEIEGEGIPHGYKKMESLTDTLDWQASQQGNAQFNYPIANMAPWQRIILCEGLDFAPPTAKRQRAFPFLVYDDKSDPVRQAADLHLAGQPRGGSDTSNPYTSRSSAFHIPFFERLSRPRLYTVLQNRVDIKTGRLYKKPRSARDSDEGERKWTGMLLFRRSLFTVISAPANSGWYWHCTMLILVPSDLYPVQDGFQFSYDCRDWGRHVVNESLQTAELSCILYALQRIKPRWRRLDEYIGQLLVEDFMDPESYCELLFNDAAFSRSRVLTSL